MRLAARSARTISAECCMVALYAVAHASSGTRVTFRSADWLAVSQPQRLFTLPRDYAGQYLWVSDDRVIFLSLPASGCGVWMLGQRGTPGLVADGPLNALMLRLPRAARFPAHVSVSRDGSWLYWNYGVRTGNGLPATSHWIIARADGSAFLQGDAAAGAEAAVWNDDGSVVALETEIPFISGILPWLTIDGELRQWPFAVRYHDPLGLPALVQFRSNALRQAYREGGYILLLGTAPNGMGVAAIGHHGGSGATVFQLDTLYGERPTLASEVRLPRNDGFAATLARMADRIAWACYGGKYPRRRVRVYVSGLGDSTVRQIADVGDLRTPAELPRGTSYSVTGLEWTPDGKHVTFCQGDGLYEVAAN